MALQTSGQISLDDIRQLLGGSGQISLNDANVRDLISKSSGTQMSLSEWYGASSGPSLFAAPVTSMRTNYYQFDKNNPDRKAIFFADNSAVSTTAYNIQNWTSSTACPFSDLFGSSYMDVKIGGYSVLSNLISSGTQFTAYHSEGKDHIYDPFYVHFSFLAICSYGFGVSGYGSSSTPSLSVSNFPKKMRIYNDNDTSSTVSITGLDTRALEYGVGYGSTDHKIVFEVFDDGTTSSGVRIHLFGKSSYTTEDYGADYPSSNVTIEDTADHSGWAFHDWASPGSLSNLRSDTYYGTMYSYRKVRKMLYIDYDGSVAELGSNVINQNTDVYSGERVDSNVSFTVSGS